MLKIKKGGRIFFEEEEIHPDQIDLGEFLMANLGMVVQIEDGVVMEDVLNPISNIRNFIYSYFSDHYDKLKALITSKHLGGDIQYIKVFPRKSFEENYMFSHTCIDFISSSQQKEDHNDTVNADFYFLSQMPICIDNNVDFLIDEEMKGVIEVNGEIKEDITLLQLLESLFDDLVNSLTHEFI